jgi:hypothetical protein
VRQYAEDVAQIGLGVERWGAEVGVGDTLAFLVGARYYLGAL